jgi:hypothetical protein
VPEPKKAGQVGRVELLDRNPGDRHWRSHRHVVHVAMSVGFVLLLIVGVAMVRDHRDRIRWPRDSDMSRFEAEGELAEAGLARDNARRVRATSGAISVAVHR